MQIPPAIQTLRHTLLHSGIVDLYRDRVMLPEGGERDYTVIDYPPSVAIVPVAPDGSILLLRQYRYVLQDWSWELPGGIIDDRETPMQAALRELQEESGYAAHRMELLATVSPDTCLSTQKVHIFLATRLVPVYRSLADAENIDPPVSFSLHAVRSMVQQGTFTDAVSIIGLLHFLLFKD